jgi:formate/nitrite transporter
VSSGYLTPAEIVDYTEHAAMASNAMPRSRFVVRAMMGGLLLGMGGLLSTIVAGGSTGLAANNPGLQKFVLGALFPLGFMAVVITGADLFTSNCATFTVAMHRRAIGLGATLRTWTWSYLGNFAGALVAATLLGIATGLYHSGDAATTFLHGMVEGKADHSISETFARGIGANILVCIAAWQAYAARDGVSRMLGIWFPVMGFVAMGMEHSVANMFFFPAAILSGADITWGTFLVHNLLFATLGNIVGGALFVGLAYAFVYPGRPEREAPADEETA